MLEKIKHFSYRPTQLKNLGSVKGKKVFFNLSLIDTKLGVWVAYNKTQLGIATQVSVVKVKVTVTQSRNSVSAQ